MGFPFVKGAIDYFGKDQLASVLWNSDGNAMIGSADERVTTYGMGGFARVRSDRRTFEKDAQRLFGQFGYGYILIGRDGTLLGANLDREQLFSLLDKQFNGPEVSPFATQCSFKNVRGRNSWWKKARRLTQTMTAILVVELKLPKGYHVYGSGKANPTPTLLNVAYARGVTVGKAEIQNANGDPKGIQRVAGPVRIHVPITMSKGSPIGEYFLHGTVKFMACSDKECMPPAELRWHAKVKVQ